MSYIKTKNKSKIPIILFALLLASMFGGVGVYTLYEHKTMLAGCSQITEGTIVEKRAGYLSGGRGSMPRKGYEPVVEYYIDGEKVTVPTNYMTNRTGLEIGDSVIVHYNPNTGEFWVEGLHSKVIPYIMGMAFICVAILIGPTITLLVLRIAPALMKLLAILASLGLVLCFLVFVLRGIILGFSVSHLRLIGIWLIFVFFVFKINQRRNIKSKENEK